ncbi:MAG TPA: hypothetical protein VN048_11265 [Verrucomicrobiae bacterium]|jgi:hypothetical protein|nr:hypothetical protein [Verrucomicrobiae bacterium]
MQSNRPFSSALVRGVAFWCMVIGSAVFIPVGYVGMLMPVDWAFLLGLLMFILGAVGLVCALRHAFSKAVKEPRRSTFTAAALVTCAVLAGLGPFLFRKRTVPLMSEGRVVAIAKRPWSWSSEGDNEFGVYVGKTKIFSLWGDMFDCPLFIYPFADGRRFLCIDDDDTSVLVFIVDFTGTGTNVTNQPGWPPNDYTRNYLVERAPRIVMDTKGTVRLPSYAEVQEASRTLMKLTPGELKSASFPSCDFGLCRLYVPKEFLLRQLDTNRQSVWPES